MVQSDLRQVNAAFLDCVAPLLSSREVNEMRRWRHHYAVTCYEHSLFVSYVAFRIARRFGWDCRAAARAGLLHDLFLYDSSDRSAHPGNQCLDHPVAALRNARALCPDLSEKEANAILTHISKLANDKCEVLVGNVQPFDDLDTLIDDKRVVVRTDKFQCLLVHQVKEGVGGRYVFAMSDMRLQLSGLTHVVAV